MWFPSPADNHLNQLILILKNINNGLEPRNGKIAVCYIDGEFIVKWIKFEKARNA